MILNKLPKTTFTALFAALLLFTGCDFNGNSGTGTMEVMLHDAPATYDEVNVFIERVEVNNTQNDEGWVEISSPQQSYDLLKLTNGAMAQLASTELEVGTYKQIRLILSREGHSVMVDGVPHDMFVPSGAQTGIKLNVNAEIEPDITYTLLLDFDAARSVVEQGSEQSGVEYLLQPVIRATSEAITGNISGVVEPVDSDAVVEAIDNSGPESVTVSTTPVSDTDGSFKLVGLEEGTYTVSIKPGNENYQPEEITGVEVTVGDTNDLGTVTLSEN